MTTKNKIVTILSVFLLIVALFLGYNSFQIAKSFKNAEAKLKEVSNQLEESELKVKIYQAFLDGNTDSLHYYCEIFESETREHSSFCLELQRTSSRLEQKSADLVLTKEELQQQLGGFKQAIDSLQQSMQQTDAQLESKSLALDSLRKVAVIQKSLIDELKKEVAVSSFDTLSFVVSTGYKIHYTGQVENSKANGMGSGFWPTGGYYHGEWKNNLRHGQGLYIWKEGHKYQGTFQNDARNGAGIYWWTNGERYEGGWKNNKRDGMGILYAADGSIKYQGKWENDKPLEL